MPFPDGSNIDLELRLEVARGLASKRRGYGVPGHEYHPIGRVNLEWNSEAAQHARLRCRALTPRKLSQISRREYQLLLVANRNAA